MLKFNLITLVCLLTMLSSYIPFTYIDSELKSYNDQFLVTMNQYCKTIPNDKPQKIIRLGGAGGSYIGVCKLGLSRWTIVFDRAYWNISNREDRFQLYAHEATHCYLDLDHSSDPGNYMYPSYIYLDPYVVQQQLINNLRKVCPNG